MNSKLITDLSSMKSMTGSIGSTKVDMLPSEVNAIYQCIVDERKSFECIQSFKSVETVDGFKEAVKRFAYRLENRIAEVGFKAVVSTDMLDPDNFDIYDDSTIEWHPSVLIDSRLSGSNAIDHDKKAWEVREGLADGKASHMDVHGQWHEGSGNKKSVLL